MSSLKISLIITVLNEASTILKLIKSIQCQTLLPSEIIIVDGGSTDATLEIILAFSKKFPQLNLRAVLVKGNRSCGRNTAIKLAKFDWIAITDAGCTLEVNWLAELIKKQTATNADVVAGYYQGLSESKFQNALIPYVLVMPDKLAKFETEVFLPATRSMLISKQIWKKAGGFDEGLSDNEDYAFSHKLVNCGAKIIFCKTAVVNWQPPNNLVKSAKMFYRFARGDAQAKIFRPKVLLIFLRYFLGLITLVCFKSNLNLSIIIIFGTFFSYSIWAILKNYRYAFKSWVWLPIIQVVSDISIILGTMAGLMK